MLFAVILPLLLLFLAVSAYNFFTAPRIEGLRASSGARPLVSVLVPARNEEQKIGDCLQSIEGLTYGNLEVIVYDDASTDGTAALVEERCRAAKNLKLIRGGKKPEGWNGKSWACVNLARAACGEVLLFVDADVVLSPSVLGSTVPVLLEREIALLSCFPHQVMRSAGEWCLVPLMHWILLSLLPLSFVYKAPNPSLSAANGQFMLFRRDAYEAIGGHEAVKNALVEDVAFAHALKRAGRKVLTCITRSAVTCRMYTGFAEGLWGFSKNFYPGFAMPKPVFLVFIGVLFTAYMVPLVGVFFDQWYWVAVAAIIFIRALIAAAAGQNVPLTIMLHPVQMVCMVAVGIASVAAYATGRVTWKGRRV